MGSKSKYTIETFWTRSNYRFFRHRNSPHGGPRKPERIPLNPIYSEPLPLP